MDLTHIRAKAIEAASEPSQDVEAPTIGDSSAPVAESSNEALYRSFRHLQRGGRPAWERDPLWTGSLGRGVSLQFGGFSAADAEKLERSSLVSNQGPGQPVPQALPLWRLTF